MCMICADEAVAIGAALVAVAPWYKSLWQRLCRRAQ